MNMIRLDNIIKNFRNKKIGIIGDIMLDHFIFGTTERISPEAPVPIVLVEREIYTPGGAGNVANNVASLNGKAYLFGIVGNDNASKILFKKLKKESINTVGIIKTSNRPTTQKSRIISKNQQITRIDRELKDNKDISKQMEKELIKIISHKIKDLDVIIISDYNKGVVTQNLVKTVINLSKKYKKYNIILKIKKIIKKIIPERLADIYYEQIDNYGGYRKAIKLYCKKNKIKLKNRIKKTENSYMPCLQLKEINTKNLKNQ